MPPVDRTSRKPRQVVAWRGFFRYGPLTDPFSACLRGCFRASVRFLCNSPFYGAVTLQGRGYATFRTDEPPGFFCSPLGIRGAPSSTRAPLIFRRRPGLPAPGAGGSSLVLPQTGGKESTPLGVVRTGCLGSQRSSCAGWIVHPSCAEPISAGATPAPQHILPPLSAPGIGQSTRVSRGHHGDATSWRRS